MAKTTGLGILEISTVFDNIKPDIVITIADRYETMSTAISASYMNIPLAHIQGGEVTGNIDEYFYDLDETEIPYVNSQFYRYSGLSFFHKNVVFFLNDLLYRI